MDRATQSAPATSGALSAPPAGVTVRMYRQGLGDCFLLAFPTAVAGQSYYVLIDCGVLMGTPDATNMMTQVANDIRSATGGELDLLIVTHRHWDHMSGFSQANSVFSGITIHNLWLSWAENPQDALASTLWQKSTQALTGLARAMTAAAEPAAMEQVARVLDFVGDLAAATSGDPLAPVRALASHSSITPEYRQPGDGPLPLPRSDGRAPAGARFYVLGPPRDLKALGQMDPSAHGQETYLTGEGLTGQLAFLMGLLDPQTLSPDDVALHDLSFPFERNLRIPRAEAAEMEFFRASYGFDDGEAPAGDEAPAGGETTGGAETPGGGSPPAPGAAQSAQSGPAWRRVDEDWLAGTETLALQLDNCINNTSMVLAVELVESGKVLLFVGDAQVGNWLSWHDLSWQLPDAGGTVQTADLLKRTVFYKVGHHGSHNATVRAVGGAPWGLELMCSADLVAMLPVDEAFAHKAPRNWQMPWPAMYDRLEELTAGRVLRIDTGVPATKPAAASDEQWAAFLAHVTATDLYLQYTLSE